MPRRKQTYEAYGKVWSPVDIPNLEKAIKCLEKINDLSENFANSLSGSEAISKQINDNFEAREELQKTGIKLNEEQTKQVLKELKARQQNNDELDDANDKLRKNNNLTWGSVGDRAASALYTRYQNNHPQATDVQLNRAATLFVRAGDVMQIAADTLHNSINTIVSVFTSGLEAQRNMYNSTFQNVSVRTGTTRSTYYANQRALPSTLQSQGLYNNVKVSEVMNMWDKLADIGMNQEQMFANALDSVITAKIVPYLDVTSRDVNILNQRLDGQFIKQIRGINQASLDLAGNNFTTQELLQTLVDQVQPMSDESLQNLTKGSAELSALINKLTPEYGADAAMSIATQLYKYQKYSDEVMRSGTPIEKQGYISMYQAGRNPYDMSQLNDIAALDIYGSYYQWAQRFPGYTDARSGLMTSYGANAIGANRDILMGTYNAINKGITPYSLWQSTEIKDEDWKKYYQNALNNLANDQNQTELTMQETLLENMSTDLAIWAQQSGMFYDVVKTALTSIIGLLGSILVNDVGGNIVSAIKGKGGGTLGKSLFKAGATGGKSGALGKVVGATNSTASYLGLTAAGGLMAVKGTSDVIGDFQSGSADFGTALSGVGAVGGAVAAGAGIAGMLGAGAAAGPVGWIALAIGGIALLGRAAWDAHEAYVESTDAMNIYNDQLAIDMENRKKQQQQEMSSYYELEERINRTTKAEDAKQLLIEAGIATEEELADAKYDNIQALKDLTKQFIDTKEAMNEEENAIFQELKTLDNQNRAGYANTAIDFVKDVMSGVGQKKMYKMNDEDRAYTEQVVKALAEYVAQADANGITLSENEEKIASVIRSQNAGDGWNWEEIDAVINEMDWHKTEANNMISKAFQNDDILGTFSSSSAVQSKTGKGRFIAIDSDAAAEYLNQAINATSAQSARTALDNFKAATAIYDIESLPSDTKAKVQQILSTHSLGSYRTGLGYVPYDNYLANLHEGEAVLTASTANELRSLVSEYRESRNSQLNFEAIVQTQTETLVAKIDQVINAINDRRMSMASASSYASTMYTNMREIKSLKSFE